MEDRKTKSGKKKFTLSGDDGEGVPPVPIPNTEVKPFSADGTWLETARESRSLPESIFEVLLLAGGLRFFWWQCDENFL